MKKLIILLMVLALGSMSLYAQVAVNTDGSAPDAAAILHVKGSGNNNFFIDDATGYVGIGTLTPAAALDIPNSTTAQEVIIGDDISSWSTGPMLNIGNTSDDGGLYIGQSSSNKGFIAWHYNATPANAYFGVGTYGGSNNLVLQQAGGNVGIGSGATSPTALLDVAGTVRFQGGLYDGNNDLGTAGQVLQTTGAATDWVDASTLSDGDWTVSGTEMYNTAPVDQVGINAMSPVAELEVNRSNTLTNSQIWVDQEGTGDATIGWDVGAQNYSIGIDNSDADKFKISNSFDVTNNNLMTFDVNGNVGIGTSSPSKKLHVFNGTGGGGGTYSNLIDGVIEDNDYAYLEFNGIGYAGITFNDDNASLRAGYFFNYNDDALMFKTGGTDGRMVIAENGNVGIGTTSPTQTLHVNGTMRLTNALYDMNNSTGSSGQVLSTTGTGTDWVTLTTGDTDWTISGSNMYSGVSGNVGIGTTAPSAKLHVVNDATSYSLIGYNANYVDYTYHQEQSADGDGQAAIYGYRTRSGASDGTGYSQSTSNQAIKGYSYWGDVYTFGVAGFNYNDYTRCGGVLGAYQGGSYWGSLGYKTSGSSTYGGYFTSSTTGSGKGSEVSINSGIAAYGDLFGADIHGKVYGTYTEGDNYAMYSKGNNYTSGLDVHLQKDGDKNQVLYTNVSTDVTVMTSGTAVLNKGNATINFDESFSSIVSEDEAIVVTVTPVGNSNGVYLNSVNKNGFQVKENNNGRSDVTVSYIAIGKRKGYENPQLAAEVIAVDYESKIENGLHNDNDAESNGQGLYYENGELLVGIHPSTLPDPNKPEGEMNQSSSIENNTIEVEEVPEAVEIFGEEIEEVNYPSSTDITEKESEVIEEITIDDPAFENGVKITEEVQEAPQKVEAPATVPVKTTQPEKREANPNSVTGGWN